MSGLKQLVVNVKEDLNQPLFRAVTVQEKFDLRATGDWAAVLFKVFQYKLEGTVLTVFHDSQDSNCSKSSAYYNPSEQVLVEMATSTSLLTPGRVLSEALGHSFSDPEVVIVGNNFDSEDASARTITLFHKTPDLGEGKFATEIDLTVFTSSDFSEYDSLGLHPAGMRLADFCENDRSAIVELVKKLRSRLDIK